MDDAFAVLVQPQAVVAALGLCCLALALSLEAVVAFLTLKSAVSVQAAAAQPEPVESYDWLYE
jgi:hypothetical protein